MDQSKPSLWWFILTKFRIVASHWTGRKKLIEISSMKIIIVIPKKPKLEVYCRPTDPLSVIKEKIFTAYGLFANFYRLYFNGCELDNNVQMLKDYGIEDGSVISLFHWNQPPENGLKKFFRLKSDNYCEWRHHSINLIFCNFICRLFFSLLYFQSIFTQKLFHSSLFVAMCLCCVCLCVASFLIHFTEHNRITIFK